MASLSNIAGAISDAFNGGGAAPSPGSKLDDIYTVDPADWYTTRAYSFIFTPRNGKEIIFHLPINPSNLTITTQFATNIVTTLYGVVEEHSEIRYYDITIQGTTGYGPRHVEMVDTSVTSTPTSSGLGTGLSIGFQNPQNTVVGRLSYSSDELVPPGLAAFAPQIAGTVNTIAGAITNVLGGDTQSGVHMLVSGYKAFHNLYRFFHIYKKDTSGESGTGPRTKHPLRFVCQRDKLQYDCIPRSFTLVRSAESPMLYNYSIVLRAHNLRKFPAPGAGGELIITNTLSFLGLANAGPSIAYKMKDLASNAMTAVAGVSSLLPL